jgi:hypothetical protein
MKNVTVECLYEDDSISFSASLQVDRKLSGMSVLIADRANFEENCPSLNKNGKKIGFLLNTLKSLVQIENICVFIANRANYEENVRH